LKSEANGNEHVLYIRGRQPLAKCVPTEGFKTFSVPTTYVFVYTSQGQYIFCVNHNKIDM